jgi:hypothetical protein
MSPTKPTEEFADDFHGQDAGRQERLRRLVQQSPKDRVADMTQRVNKPSACEYCGSTWFAELTFNQYSADAYSAAPGGDIQPISLMPMPIRVCLCGMPMAPNLGGAALGGRTPNESVSSFNGSLRVAAAKILARATPALAGTEDGEAVKRMIQNVASRVAKIESVPSDGELILSLQTRLASLEAALAEVRKTAVAVPTLAGKVRGRKANPLGEPLPEGTIFPGKD